MNTVINGVNEQFGMLPVREGWQDGQEECTLTSKPSRLGLNLDPAINCHPGVSKVG